MPNLFEWFDKYIRMENFDHAFKSRSSKRTKELAYKKALESVVLQSTMIIHIGTATKSRI